VDAGADADADSDTDAEVENAALFPPGVHQPGLAPADAVDPGLAAAVEKQGLHGLQLMSPSLHFEPLPADDAIARHIAKLLAAVPTGPGAKRLPVALYAKLEELLDAPLAVFEVLPTALRSAQPCSPLFDAAFDSGRRDFHQLHVPRRTEKAAGTTVVLGVYQPGEADAAGEWKAAGPPQFSRRLGEARGAAVHDCTAWGSDASLPRHRRNLVGPVLTSYPFHKSVADGALAKPRVAFSRRDPLYALAGGGGAPPAALVRDVLGVVVPEGEGEIVVQDPRRFFYDASFDGGERVIASAHDFQSMIEVQSLPKCLLAKMPKCLLAKMPPSLRSAPLPHDAAAGPDRPAEDGRPAGDQGHRLLPAQQRRAPLHARLRAAGAAAEPAG
jgi:hypothetical protein